MRHVSVLAAAFALAGVLALPGVALGSGKVIGVAPPSGGDDTAAIQTALNGCVGAAPGCVVQLRAGTYHTSQLVTLGFQGTFRGAGMGHTTLAALPNLSIPWDPYPCFTGSLPTCPQPDLLLFIDGSVEVSDLSVRISATNGTGTTPWEYGTGLASAFYFVSVTHLAVSVDRVAVAGSIDPSGGQFGSDFNTNNGFEFGSWSPAATGSFNVRGSSISTVVSAVVVDSVFRMSRVNVTGNTISGVDFGMWLSGPSGIFDVSFNRVSADNPDPAAFNHLGIVLQPTGLETGLTSRFSIHDNTITANDTCGCGMTGIWLLDAVGGLPHWFTATVAHNMISLPFNGTMLSGEGKAGIDVNNTMGSLIIGNKITAAPAGTIEGIGLWGNDPSLQPATRNSILANDVSGVMLDPANSWSGQILLDSFTANNLVACLRSTDTVADYGTANTVLHCDPATHPSTLRPSVLARSHSALFRNMPGLLNKVR